MSGNRINNHIDEETNGLTVSKENEAIHIVRVFAESQCARFEHIIKWLCIVIIILIGCNIAQFIINEIERSKYETVAIEAELSTDGSGSANFVGKDGDITNGEDKSKNDISQT